MLIWLLLLPLTSSLALNHDCCQNGPNSIHFGKCEDNLTSISLLCTQKYKVETPDMTLEEDRLLLDGLYYEPGQFCQAKLNGTTALLICIEEEHVVYQVLPYVNTVLNIFSIICIVLTILIYLVVPKIIELQEICIIHAIGGLATGIFFLIFNQIYNNFGETACYVIAILMYVSFIFTFQWLQILSFHIWRTTVKPSWSSKLNRYWNAIYFSVGYLIPILCLVIVVLADQSDMIEEHGSRPNIGKGTCWFNDHFSTFIYFYLPLIFLLSTNIFFYVWSVIVLLKQLNSSNSQAQNLIKMKFKLFMCLKLFCIMGISWTFECISFLSEYYKYEYRFLWILTDWINCLQGVFIFLILVVYRRRVLRGLANKNICLCLLKRYQMDKGDDETDEVNRDLDLTVIPNEKP